VILVGFYYISAETVADKALQIFGVMMLFGAPFIAINYVAGYLFKKADTAFKYSAIIMIVIFALPYLAGAIYAWLFSPSGKDVENLIKIVSYISPPALL
jgi:hypothetical protein